MTSVKAANAAARDAGRAGRETTVVQTQERNPTGKVILGAALVAVGTIGLGVIFAAVYSATPELASLGFRLGLAFGAFFSGLAQVVLVAGIWIIWSALRQRPR